MIMREIQIPNIIMYLSLYIFNNSNEPTFKTLSIILENIHVHYFFCISSSSLISRCLVLFPNHYSFICSASITSQLTNNMLIFFKTRNTVLIKYILFMHAISYFHYFPSFRMSQSNWRGKRNIISGLQIWYLSPLIH